MFDSTDDARLAIKRGLILIRGQDREPSKTDFETGFHLIAKAAQTFPSAAAILAALKALHISEEAKDNDIASTFIGAAMSGYPPAVRGLAVILLGAPKTEPMGAGLLRLAVKNGDWIAAVLLLRESLRGRILASRDELQSMADMLTDAVPLRADIRADLAKHGSEDAMISPAPFVQDDCYARLVSALSGYQKISPKPLSHTPYVAAMPSVITPLECDYLIALSSSLMRPSKVVDAQEAGAVSAGFRTSDGAVLLPAHMDIVSVIIMRKLSLAAGIEPQQGEFLSLLRYRQGQEYLPHHDFLKPDAADYSKVKSCGQRQRTLLTYLNTGYDGGETEFPKLDVTFRGQPGDSLLFENTEKDGAPFDASLHAGRPVTGGEKWLATLWCREHNFWPWMV